MSNPNRQVRRKDVPGVDPRKGKGTGGSYAETERTAVSFLDSNFSGGSAVGDIPDISFFDEPYAAPAPVKQIPEPVEVVEPPAPEPEPEVPADPVTDHAAFVAEVSRLQDEFDAVWDEHFEPFGSDDDHYGLRGGYRERQEEISTRIGDLVAARAEHRCGISVDPNREKEDAELAVEAAKAEFSETQKLIQDEQTKRSAFDSAATPEDRAAAVSDYRIKHGLADEPLNYSQASEAWDAYRTSNSDVMSEAEHNALWDVYRARQTKLRDAEAGQVEAGKERAATLADAYAETLAEIRPLGGEVAFDPASPKKARDTFANAAQVFPTEWIERQNAENAPLVKITKSRAHYSHGHVQTTKKREVQSHVRTYDSPMEQMDGIHSTYRPLTAAEKAERYMLEEENAYEVTEHEVAFDGSRWISGSRSNSWSSVEYNVAITPRGTGWQRFEAPHPTLKGDDGSPEVMTGWRRPKTRLRQQESRRVPEIRSNVGASLPGRENTYAVAVHEMSHRMEYVVPDVAELEQAFINRRCRASEEEAEYNGALKPLKPIYRGRKEYGRDGGFTSLYVGKEYDYHSFTAKDGSRRSVAPREVMSMGTEALFGGNHGALIGAGGNHQPDLDHRNFILGVLATAGRRKSDDKWAEAKKQHHIF